jgi:hypothetical protein
MKILIPTSKTKGASRAQKFGFEERPATGKTTLLPIDAACEKKIAQTKLREGPFFAFLRHTLR